jgi:hypothetical protein
VKRRLAFHQIAYPSVAVPLNPVINHVVPALGWFSEVHTHHFPSPPFVNDFRKVPDEELNPVRREARSHDEKDIRVKRLVMSCYGGDRISSRVLFIVKHDVRSKPPNCGCALPFCLSVVGYLSTVWARRLRVWESLHFSITFMPGKIARTVGTSKAVETSMEKNTFDTSAIVLASSFMVGWVNAFQPAPSAKPRSTSWALSWIRREANLLFKAVDVLGVVPNQLARIAQITDETVCCCRIGLFSGSTHAGDALVKERPSLRIEEDRPMEKMTVT